jgi:hypothetical protein
MAGGLVAGGGQALSQSRHGKVCIGGENLAIEADTALKRIETQHHVVSTGHANRTVRGRLHTVHPPSSEPVESRRPDF